VWWILNTTETPRVVLSIAGSDPGGGAGIQADLKTFAAMGVYGCTVITALTAQNTQGVSDAIPVPLPMIRAQFRALKEDMRPVAIKTGMLYNAEIAQDLARLLGRPPLPLVVDPVLMSSSGMALMDEAGLKVYREQLIPLAIILTPNLDEAARLLESAPIEDLDAMKKACQALLKFGCRSVYLKGGHLKGDWCNDIFYDGKALVELSSPRIDTRNTHGTGCALSAALCAGLAKGLSLQENAKEAKAFVQGALEGARLWKLGQGHGPMNHFFARGG
jgi:hydroxymethylpyrimidine/phosphomethylpyrimidine kinase